ncbi:hypothetical protein Tco_0601836 [Tanacetum coccineum]
MERTTSGGGPRRQETMGDTIAQTRSENVSKLSNDPLLARGNTLRSGEDSLKLNELMELCTNLQTRVLDLETTKTTQDNEIAKMFDVDTLTGDKKKGDVIKEPSVPASTVTASTKDNAATTTTATIPTPRKGIVFQEPGTTTTTTISSQQPSQENVQDKGKGKMVEPKKPMKKKELIRLDKEIASKLQAKFDEEAKIEDDHELAQRLQAQEQEELSDAEKATC